MLLDAPGEDLERILGEREQNVLLVGEIGIDRHRRIADTVGELADGQALIALFLHQRMRRREKLGAEFFLLAFAAVLCGSGHGFRSIRLRGRE